jgi:hypothetical protein
MPSGLRSRREHNLYNQDQIDRNKTFTYSGLELPGRDSNPHRENQNPLAPPHNSFQGKPFTPIHTSGRTAGRTSKGEGAIPTDPGLAAVIVAWPTLAEPLRRAILALIGERL